MILTYCCPERCTEVAPDSTYRRQGNKKITKLSGLESFLIDGEALASELQKKFAVVQQYQNFLVRVQELWCLFVCFIFWGGKKGLEVLVQCVVIDDVGRRFVEQYGVQKRCIEVLTRPKNIEVCFEVLRNMDDSMAFLVSNGFSGISVRFCVGRSWLKLLPPLVS